MNKKFILITSLIFSAMLMAACGSTATVAEESVAEAETSAAVLTLSGEAVMTWTTADLEGMTQVEADYTNKDGETTTFSGVALSELFSAAGVSEYTTVTLVASDDYAAEVTFDELSTCEACLVAIQDDGTFISVMPDMSSKVQVKGLVEIQVQ